MGGLDRGCRDDRATFWHELERLLTQPHQGEDVHRIGLFHLLRGEVGNLVDRVLLASYARQHVKPA
jgi:hypothetical protein